MSVGEVFIRADAGLNVGTGHVRRCLSLANEIQRTGGRCTFLMREGVDDLADEVRAQACEVRLLTGAMSINDWQADAGASISALRNDNVDWLITDNYDIDFRWHHELRPYVGKIMVIDDMANRRHVCDLLLDQTLGRNATDYAELIPTDCRKILGSAHTLLRQEFPELREAALTRRQSVNQISSVLVSTGGGDDGGVTLEIVRHLSMLPAMTQPNVTVIMPDKAASYLSVRALIDEMGDKAKLLSNVKNMEQHIYDADFAFGSGGTTAWERCCLGLPTALVVLAENQKFLAQQLEEAGAAILIDMKIVGQSWVKLLLEGLNHDMREYSQMVRAAAKICDGMGARRVVKTMRAFNV